MNRKTLIDQLVLEVPGSCACFKVRSAARKVTRRYEEALKPTGLTGTQYTLLVAFLIASDQTLSEIAEQLGMERTTLLRNLKPLQRDGLIDIASGQSGRTRAVTVTDKGVVLMGEALPMWRVAQERLKAELGEPLWHQVQESLNMLGQVA